MIALALALFANVAAQDDLDAAIKDLATKISKDGVSGRLAEAAAQEWGLQAIKEKIEFLLGAKTGRYERDPLGYYEDTLFSADGNGDLQLRPERKDEMQRLAARMSRAADSMKDFNHRCDEMVKRIDPAREFEKRAKESWSDPAFRLAYFHRHPAELRQLSPDELADALFLHGLERGKDGKLRVGGPFADEMRQRMDAAYGTLDMLKTYEKAYLQEAAKVKDAGARAIVASDEGILFILGRLLRQASEGGAESIGGITEGDEDNNKPPVVSFNLGLEELAPLVKEAETVAAGLKSLFEKTLPEIAGAAEPEINVLEFLKNGRARMLLAERAMAMRKEQKDKADEIMNAAIEDGFEVKDGRLRVKKGRFVNDQNEESIDALNAELNNVIEEFNGSVRQDFDRIAERCLEAPVIAMFEDRAATFLLMDHRDLVIASAVDAVKRQGLDVFTKTYLAKQGETYVVRPERARRVEAILERAAAIKKEMEK
jgi:hypothetical protein